MTENTLYYDKTPLPKLSNVKNVANKIVKDIDVTETEALNFVVRMPNVEGMDIGLCSYSKCWCFHYV